MRRFEMSEFLGQPVSNTFNPPGCPIPRHGEPVDLSSVPIYAYAEDTPQENGGSITEIWFALGERDAGHGNLTNFVETAILTVDEDDPLAKAAHALKSNEQAPQLEQIREALIARTKQCPGVRNGECWALGASAVKKVISDLNTATEE